MVDDGDSVNALSFLKRRRAWVKRRRRYDIHWQSVVYWDIGYQKNWDLSSVLRSEISVGCMTADALGICSSFYSIGGDSESSGFLRTLRTVDLLTMRVL